MKSKSGLKNEKLRENMFGDEDHQKLAREVLPLLIEKAKAHDTINYGDLADKFEINPYGAPMSPMLGCIVTTLYELGQEWEEEIPYLTALVVKVGTGYPSFPANTSNEVFDSEFEQIFKYRKWDAVQKKLLSDKGKSPKFMIKSLKLKSYRGFSDTNIEFSDITCIVGENSTGKSTIIQAIQDFFSPSISPIETGHCKVGINDNNTTSLSLALRDGRTLSKNIQNVEGDYANLPECITSINAINTNYHFSVQDNPYYEQPIKDHEITDILWRNILGDCNFTLRTAAESITSGSSARGFNHKHTSGISQKFTDTFNDMLKESNRQYKFEVYFERDENDLIVQLLSSYRVNDNEPNEGSQPIELNYESVGFRTLIALCSYHFNDKDQSEKIFVMDEPFREIHPKAQMEVSRMLQSLSQRFQIIYTTHCPHLLPERDKVICTFTEAAGDLSICGFEEYPSNLFYDLSPLALDTIEKIKGSDSAISVFVEGKTDEKIYEKFFKEVGISDMIDIRDVNGVGNMPLYIKASAGINKPSLFIIDPGENPRQLKGCRQEIEKHHNLFLLVLPCEENNHVKKGIENLMPNHIIERAYRELGQVVQLRTTQHYGEEPTEQYIPLRKPDLADFFVDEAQEDDYEFFSPIIDKITEICQKSGIELKIESDDQTTLIADYTQAIALNPSDADAYNNRGVAYFRKGDIHAAIADYAQAIALNPSDADAYNNRGVAYFRKGDIHAAIADYTQAIALNPSDADAYNNRGVAYFRKGDIHAAIADYAQAIALNPSDADAYNNRGKAWLHLSVWLRAKADLTTAKEKGYNIIASFQNDYESVEDFEAKHGVKMPEDLAVMLRRES